jgi:hypothetical protein
LLVHRHIARSRTEANLNADRIRQGAADRHGSVQTETAANNSQHFAAGLSVPPVTHQANVAGGAVAPPPCRVREVDPLGLGTVTLEREAVGVAAAH